MSKIGLRNLVLGLVAVLSVSGASVAIGLFVLDRIGIDVARRIWLLRESILGPQPAGVHQASDRYGWVHVPSAIGWKRVVPDFDVEYHIDERGHRLTPGGPSSSAPIVLFLGGSFTFGSGVEDDETYPAILQAAWPELRVVNAAVNAWGTTHALLALNDELAANDRIVLVVYGFITHHMFRNYLRKSWLDILKTSNERRNPYFELVGGQLVFKGLADPALDGLPDTPELARTEVLLTKNLLNAMATRCAEYDVPFVVAYLPDGSHERKSLSMLGRGSATQTDIDLRSSLKYKKMRFEHDIHPHPKGHREIASILRPYLESRLTQRTSSTAAER